MDPVQAWHTDHAYFQRLLALLQREIDVFHGGERPNYELMLDIVTYLREFSDEVHHPREDVAFARLAKRVPALALPITRLVQEHRVIASAGDALRELLSEVLDGAMVTRHEIERAAATYLVYYANHIAREEKEVMSAAGKALTPKDWEAVRDAVAHRPDPLFGAEPEARFRELRRQIALES